MQTNWYWLNGVVSVLSVGTWIGVGYIVTNSVFIDFDFYYVSSARAAIAVFTLYTLTHCCPCFRVSVFLPHLQLWIRLLKNGSFWLTLLVVVMLVFVKDLAMAAYVRFYHPSPVHILQEVRAPDRHYIPFVQCAHLVPLLSLTD